MRFGSVYALLALAAGAVAQTSIPPQVQNSVLLVLATALPADQRNYALASQSAFAAQMASSLAAGNTPAWYQALPSDVKSLLPALYPASATATPTPSASLSFSSVASISASISASPIGVNSTSITAVRTPTLSASATRSSAAVATTNAAPYPSVALGASVGAALGVLGMLAL